MFDTTARSTLNTKFNVKTRLTHQHNNITNISNKMIFFVDLKGRMMKYIVQFRQQSTETNR